jgi:glycyl-radical enzyme activating protein
MTSGTVFDLQRFSIHDGPGIRTTVFLKGCALRCLWCHNPESMSFDSEIAFTPAKCIACGACARACTHGCHVITDAGRHEYRNAACVRCGECAGVCAAGALEVIGRERSTDEVLAEALRDRAYYDTSGGGLTISGGEPTGQEEFTAALLAAAKGSHGLHTCVETCGHAPFDRLARLLTHVDLFLYDIKETEPRRHREYTGVDNELILANLARLDGAGARIVLRCPIIPTLNDRDDHFIALAALAEKFGNVQGINVLAFHPYAEHKWNKVMKPYSLRHLKAPDEPMVKDWIKRIKSRTSKPVKRG